MKKSGTQQFFVFAGMGAIGTLFHFAILILLVQLFNWHPVLATFAGFSGGAAVNYILNYHITFGSSKRHHDAFVKFLIIAIIGAILNSALMSLGLQVLRIHYLLIQALATTITLLWNFIANKHWTFA